MINKTSIKFIFVLIISLLYITEAKSQYTYLEEQKAEYIYQFPQFLFWEGDDYIDVINIGIYKGSDEMKKELKKAFKKKYGNGTKAELVEFNSISEFKNSSISVHMLYVEEEYKDEYETFLETAQKKSTALITENWNVTEKFMFDLFEETSVKINFRFNRQNIIDANISILDQISMLKGIDIDAQQLLIEAQEDLETVQQSLEEKQAEIKIQQKELEEQKAKIDEQKIEIEKQEKNIDEQKLVYADLLEDVKLQQVELASKNAILENQTSQIQSQQQQLLAQQEEYEQQLSMLEQQEEMLENQKKEFEKYELEIQEKQKELSKLEITIQLQRNALFILIGLVTAIFVLAFFVFRGYRIKKKQNQQLEEQKEEIQAQAEELEAINVELEKLSIVASETSSAVAILDAKGNFEWVNAGFTRLYGYTIQLLINELDENIKGVSNHPKIAEILERCIKNKKTEIFETFISTRENSKLWAQTTMTPILDTNENIAKIVLIDSDITAIKEAEEEIKRQNEKILTQSKELEIKNHELAKLSLVAEKTTNSVIIANAKGNIEWVNAGFERLMEISFNELQEHYGLNLMGGALSPDVIASIEKNLEEKISSTYTSKIQTKNGR